MRGAINFFIRQPALIVAVVGIIAIVSAWRSLSAIDTIVVMCTFAIMGVSLALIYGQAGVMSLAQAAFASIGAYCTAIMTARFDLPVLLGLIAAILLPAAFGLLVARVVGRMSHMALAVSTLLVSQVVIYAIASWSDLTGGYLGISGIPRAFFMPDIRTAAIIGLILVIVCIYVLQRVIRSEQGRAYRTIAADGVLSSSLGINVAERLGWLFALSAGMAGVAGWFYAHSRSFIAPDALTIDTSLSVLFMVIVGGSATILGPVVGAVVLTLIRDMVPNAALGGVFYGIALIVVLLVLPKGLLGTNWLGMLRGRRRAGSIVDAESTSTTEAGRTK